MLFLNGPNVNCRGELETFKEIQKETADTTIQYQPLGSIQAERISKLIIRSACKGDWLLLDNLQLAINDLPNLLKFVEDMYEGDVQAKAQLKKSAEAQIQTVFEKVKLNQDISADESTILEIIKAVE